MALIKGIPVILYQRTKTGESPLHEPVYAEIPVTVDNVLVTPAAAQDVVDGLQLYGKRAEYLLCLPKGDTHSWEDCRVEFFGRSWRVFGPPLEYIPALVPLGWNKQIKVERYE